VLESRRRCPRDVALFVASRHRSRQRTRWRAPDRELPTWTGCRRHGPDATPLPCNRQSPGWRSRPRTAAQADARCRCAWRRRRSWTVRLEQRAMRESGWGWTERRRAAPHAGLTSQRSTWSGVLTVTHDTPQSTDVCTVWMSEQRRRMSKESCLMTELMKVSEFVHCNLDIHNACDWQWSQSMLTKQNCVLYTVYTVSQKTIYLTFDHDFGKCRPIFKILWLSYCQEHSLFNCCRAFHLTLTVSLHYHAKFKKKLNNGWALLMPSKLINFTWNLTKLNNI